MATFFGEVVSMYSRAVGEDEEDLDENEEDEEILRELEEKREVHLEWSPEAKQSMERSGSNVLQCSDFILAVGHNAASFLSVYVLNSGSWESVGHASLWNERTRGFKGQNSEEPACGFFRRTDNPSVLICQNTCYIAEDQLFQWTEKVFGCLQKRGLSVTVLSDSPIADYKTSDYLSSAPFLRSLRTSAYDSKPPCPPLEQPNIVTGLTASVLSYCQVHQIPAVAYQCYSDIISPDSVTMETYKPVLTSLSKCIKLDPCPSVDTFRKFVKTSEIQSNLYI